jgi:hypothetical protein
VTWLRRGRRAALPGVVVVAVVSALIAASCSRGTQTVHHTNPISGVTSLPSPTVSPTAGGSVGPPGTEVGCSVAGTVVSTADQLTSALTAPAPGTVINLAPGTYSGQFVTTASGTEAAPITLCGPRSAILDGGTIKLGYTFHLNGASWWKLIGFTVQNGQKGVMTDHANHNLIANLLVQNIGDEGIHLRGFSSDNTVQGNVVRNTGLLVKKFGEGIYVGTANKNWCKWSNCVPDKSDRNVVRGNDVAQTTAENIDIKEGTTGGLIDGNHLNGAGMVSSAATSWINVKGNAWTVTNNVGVQSNQDGFSVHRVYSGWGEGNIFRGNTATVDGPGYGIYVQSHSLGTTVACDNVAINAGSGLSNMGCG